MTAPRVGRLQIGGLSRLMEMPQRIYPALLNQLIGVM